MDDFDSDFKEYIREVGNSQGLDGPTVDIISALFLEPAEISMEELARRTGYCNASISNKIKMLESIRLIRKIRKPGTKKVFVYMEKDFLELMKKQLLVKHETIIRIANDRIPVIIKKYQGTAKSEAQKRKLKILEDYHKQIVKADVMLHKIIEILNKA